MGDAFFSAAFFVLLPDRAIPPIIAAATPLATVRGFSGRIIQRGHTRNPKSETRNPNQATNPKPQTASVHLFQVSGFGHSFGFLVSGFWFFSEPSRDHFNIPPSRRTLLPHDAVQH
jgi:hypothetical protein